MRQMTEIDFRSVKLGRQTMPPPDANAFARSSSKYAKVPDTAWRWPKAAHATRELADKLKEHGRRGQITPIHPVADACRP